MFTVKKVQPEEPTELEKELDRLIAKLSSISPEDERYAKVAEQLVKLYKLKEVDIIAASKKRVSPDTIAIIIGNLVGIGAVLGYERAGVVTSRAFGLVMKLAR